MDANSIVSKTKSEAFPDGPQLVLENFESYGGGGMQTVATAASESPDAQKQLQESYRSGLSKSKAATEPVTGR